MIRPYGTFSARCTIKATNVDVTGDTDGANGTDKEYLALNAALAKNVLNVLKVVIIGQRGLAGPLGRGGAGRALGRDALALGGQEIRPRRLSAGLGDRGRGGRAVGLGLAVGAGGPAGLA